MCEVFRVTRSDERPPNSSKNKSSPRGRCAAHKQIECKWAFVHTGGQRRQQGAAWPSGLERCHWLQAPVRKGAASSLEETARVPVDGLGAREGVRAQRVSARTARE